MTIKLCMSRERAILLMRACEIITRCGIGQFGDLLELLMPKITWEEKHNIEIYLKSYLREGLNRSGIGGERTPEECQVAWDAYQHLRREVSWSDKGLDWRKDNRDWQSDMMSVCFDAPMKVSRTDGDFTVEVEK